MTPAKTVSPPRKRAPRVIEGTRPPEVDASRQILLQSYEAALRLMGERKYDKAHAAFEKMLAAEPNDLADRIRMYMSACLQQNSKSARTFSSPEEQFDYAISLLNEGHFDDAREQLESITKQNGAADYASYGLAVLASLTSDANRCLEYLTEAIRLNPQNRIHARSDSDFQNMADDPRFTELLYPEL